MLNESESHDDVNPYVGRYQPGDILTACDNEMLIPSGYLGHSAIVVNEHYLVEAVTSIPYIRLVPIPNFTSVHPKHALFRPKDVSMGIKAAQWAISYYRFSEYNRMQGFLLPVFSFTSKVPLSDMFRSVYCSKLVWLSYFYGCGYSFYNDFFLFTPEDLFTVLSRDPTFILLYKHPEFLFHINT